MNFTLKAARVNKGLKQTDVAQALHVSRSTIMSWENGKTAPRIDQMRQLCELYNMPIDNFILTKMLD